MITILSYILIRLFVPKKNYYLEGDELRHIVSARNFYTLWNKSLYDTHPPFYSWLIKIFKSGVMVSFLCSVGLYLVSSALYSAVGLSPYQKTIALTFLAFNYTLIYYSNRVFRYQLIALLGTLMIYLLVTHQWIAAGCSWGLLGLTCTFAGLRGFFAWGLLGINPFVLSLYINIFSSWLLIKAQTYRKNIYHPSGIEGMIEQVYPFTFKQLLSPLHFPWVHSYYGKKELAFTLKGWMKRVGGIFGLYPPLTFLVPIAVFVMIRGALVSPLWLSLLVLALLYPSLLKRYLPRNSIIAIPLIGILIARGMPQIPLNLVFLGQFGALVGFLLFNRVGMLTKPKIRAFKTSKYLDKLPKDGVLVDGMICQPIAYWTKKRVVVLSYSPNENDATFETDLAIKIFNLNYVVTSKRGEGMKPVYPALDHIKMFKEIKIIHEDNDTYTVYEI